MSYDRKIKYVDVFENGEKVQNAGFVRFEKKDEKVSIHVKVSNLKRSDSCLCPIILVGDGKEVKLGELILEQGEGCYVNQEANWEEIADGITYDFLREVRIALDREVVLRCIISEEVTEEPEVPEEPEVTEDHMQERSELLFKSEAELLREAFAEERRLLERDAITLEEDIELPSDEVPWEETFSQEEPTSIEIPSEKTGISRKEESGTTRLPAESKWQQLWDIYPHIAPFEDGREYLLVKPADFVILREKYYSLTSNSFLLHGYYNYNHLIMTRESKTQGEKIFIGVPGTFYEKEKQVAVLFGFESFEGRYEPAGNGDFGYYMVGVEI